MHGMKNLKFISLVVNSANIFGQKLV